MKKVKIIMNSGKEYIYSNEYRNACFSDVSFLLDENGIPRNRFVCLTGSDMPNAIMINPKHVSSIEEFEE